MKGRSNKGSGRGRLSRLPLPPRQRAPLSGFSPVSFESPKSRTVANSPPTLPAIARIAETSGFAENGGIEYAQLFSPLPQGTPRTPLECISEEEEGVEFSLEDLQLVYAKDWASLHVPACADEAKAIVGAGDAKIEESSSPEINTMATPCRSLGFVERDSGSQEVQAVVSAEQNGSEQGSQPNAEVQAVVSAEQNGTEQSSEPNAELRETGCSESGAMATPCRVLGFAESDSEAQEVQAVVREEKSAKEQGSEPIAELCKTSGIESRMQQEGSTDASKLFSESVWQKLESLEQSMNKVARKIFDSIDGLHGSIDSLKVRVDSEISNLRSDEEKARREFADSVMVTFESHKKIFECQQAKREVTCGHATPPEGESWPPSPLSVLNYPMQVSNFQKPVQDNSLEMLSSQLAAEMLSSQLSANITQQHSMEASKFEKPIQDSNLEMLSSHLSANLMQQHALDCEETFKKLEALNTSVDTVTSSIVDIDFAGAGAVKVSESARFKNQEDVHFKFEEIDLHSDDDTFREGTVPQEMSLGERLQRNMHIQGWAGEDDILSVDCISPVRSSEIQRTTLPGFEPLQPDQAMDTCLRANV